MHRWDGLSDNTRSVWAVLGLAMILAASGAVAHSAGAAPSAPDAAVAIEGFQFRPRTLEVRAGTKVVWTNNDVATHTVTSGTPGQRTDAFNHTLQGRARFEFTFARAGTFPYFCNRHQSMRGEVVVRE